MHILKKYGRCILLGLLAYGVVSIYFTKPETVRTEIVKTEYHTYFAILPHFAIQPATIDNAYQEILDTYNLSGKSLQILIISPDHFLKESNDLHQQIIDKPLCFQSNCLTIHAMYIESQKDIPDIQIQEHGRGAHFVFIKKYFPQAEVSLAKLAPRDFMYLDKLSAEFHQLEKSGNLLVIASVDFSHYISDQRAKVHDLKSYYTLLHACTQAEYQTIEVDCPTCLFLVNSRAKSEKQYPQLIKRDSNSTIENKDLGVENTSRQFFIYTGQQSQDNGIVLGFFGDLMFDRGVQFMLNATGKIQKHFQDRYQQGNTGLSPEFFVHRKGFGLDILGYNLETPFVNENCLQHTNGISFCSSGAILGMLQSLGFSTVTIANNHMRDDGQAGYMQTLHNLQANNIDYAGRTHFSGINKNTVLTENIRGMHIALHAYDLYNRFSGDMDGYCADLKRYQKQGYKNIVSIHRGNEFETTHNALQERIGKKLIDCGADMIIGHHPHVVQDIQRYKNKPIIYSLGNFLFDQYFSAATEKGMYVLAHIPLSGNIEIRTGEVSSTP